MRIGIDGLPLTEVLTGIGHYTSELAQHLALETEENEIEIITPRAFLPSLNNLQERPNLRFRRSRLSPLTRRWWSIGLPRYLRRHPLAVFHGTNYEVPLQKVCATVVTIHDLSMLLYPQTQERKRIRRSQRRLPIMARAATMIITPTESVRGEVHEHLQIPLERIVAVPEAARSCFRRLETEQTTAARQRLGIQDEFLLFVGTVEPRKNLGILLTAFEEVLRLGAHPLQLVIAGRAGWLVNDLFSDLKRSPAAAKIVVTGYLSDDDLCALYSSCAAFVYPSIYEGFGLPPLEAMACGASVLASRIPSIAEVTGSAARLFAPESIGELVTSIRELLSSDVLKQTLSNAGAKRAQEFSWARTASLTRSVYLKAIERFSRELQKPER